MQQITTLQYNGFSVMFQDDAFINATAIAKQFGKRTENYLRTNETKEYVSALQKWLFPTDNSNALKSVIEQNQDVSVALKSVTEQNQLVIVKGGSTENGGGTWLHPKLAVNFARWLNADFAVWCDMQIDKLLHPKPYGLKELPVEFISYAQCQEIRRIVKGLTGGDNSKYPSIYWSLHNRYSVNHYDKIPASQFDDAIMFLTGKPPVKMVLISETELEQLRHDKQFDYVRFIDLVNKSNEAGYVMVNKHTLRSAFHFLESSIKQYI
jgi:hypothetical protein